MDNANAKWAPHINHISHDVREDTLNTATQPCGGQGAARVWGSVGSCVWAALLLLSAEWGVQ